MSVSLMFSLFAVAVMLPSAAIPFLPSGDGTHRQAQVGYLSLAVAGPTIWSAIQMSGPWRADFSMALWLSISATLVCFLIVTWTNIRALKLTALLLPYLTILGLAATIFTTEAKPSIDAELPFGWITTHVLFSIVTYALITLAAIAGFSVFLTENALKRKSPRRLTAVLPAIMDAERLQVGLLIATAFIMFAGLMSGTVLRLYENGRFFVADHKTVLSIGAFLLIVGLLVAHKFFGIRGKFAARIVLIAYLLLTLGYLGVKFVTDLLL